MPVRITSKGQVTIPKKVRDCLGVKAGDQIEFVQKDGAVVVQRHFDADAFQRALDKWSGRLKHLQGRDPDELVREMRDPWP